MVQLWDYLEQSIFLPVILLLLLQIVIYLIQVEILGIKHHLYHQVILHFLLH